MDMRFVIIAPPRQKNAITVRLPILVGRGEEAKFRIQQDSVSRRHCEFFEESGSVFVRDVGSTNGTLLDGERIAAGAACPVGTGARVQVGGLVFRVEFGPATTPEGRRTPEQDTLPVSADARPEAAAAGDVAEPAVPEVKGLTGLVAEPAAGQPAAAPFEFLAAPAEESPAEADDGQLDDFFKSLK